MCVLTSVFVIKPRLAMTAAEEGRRGFTSVMTQDSSGQLRLAAKAVEDAAFELATSQPTEVISQLIIIAADLERLAHVVEPQFAQRRRFNQ